jgi:hypothetical protein
VANSTSLRTNTVCPATVQTVNGTLHTTVHIKFSRFVQNHTQNHPTIKFDGDEPYFSPSNKPQYELTNQAKNDEPSTKQRPWQRQQPEPDASAVFAGGLDGGFDGRQPAHGNSNASPCSEPFVAAKLASEPERESISEFESLSPQDAWRLWQQHQLSVWS